MEERELREMIDKRIATTDHAYFIVTGYFMSRFALVEMSIATLLAMVSNIRDTETFHVLTKGMDARVKIERLKKLAARNGGLGARLKARVDYFESAMVPIRNDLAHGALWTNQTDPGRFHVVTIDTFKWAQFKGENLDKAPRSHSATDLVNKSDWMVRFQADLTEPMVQAMSRQPLEITSPTTRVPKENQPDRHQPKHSSNARKPRGKPSQSPAE